MKKFGILGIVLTFGERVFTANFKDSPTIATALAHHAKCHIQDPAEHLPIIGKLSFADILNQYVAANAGSVLPQVTLDISRTTDTLENFYGAFYPKAEFRFSFGDAVWFELDAKGHTNFGVCHHDFDRTPRELFHANEETIKPLGW